MSRAAGRKSLAARRSPLNVSSDTVEGFDAAAGNFRRSPGGTRRFWPNAFVAASSPINEIGFLAAPAPRPKSLASRP